MTKRFGQVEALVDVDLELYADEVVASSATTAPATHPTGRCGIDLHRRQPVKIRNAQDAYKLGTATV